MSTTSAGAEDSPLPPPNGIASGIAISPPAPIVCLGLAALGLIGSLGVGLQSIVSGHPFAAGSFVNLLPPLTALLSMIGGTLCLLSARTGAAPAVMPGMATTHAVHSGLQQCVRELGSLLTEERGRVVSLQEICNAGMRDARSISARVENLAEAALEAETRLANSVAHAAETAQYLRSAVPDISAIVRQGVAEAVSARLGGDVDALLQPLRFAMIEASKEIAGLAEATVTVRRDLTSMQTAGREITVAGASVVARLGNAIGQIDSAVAGLPGVAEDVAAAASGAIASLTDSSAVLRGDVDAVRLAAGEAQAAAVALRDVGAALLVNGQSVDNALAALPSAGAAVSAAGAKAADMIADAASVLTGNASAMQAASDKVVALVGDAVAHIDIVLGELTPAAANVTGAVEHGRETLAEASAMLRMNSSALSSSAGDTRLVLRQVADDLGTAAQTLADAGHQTLARVEGLVGTTLSRLETAASLAPGGIIAAQPDMSGPVQTLERTADQISQAAERLRTTGDRIATSGEQASGALTKVIARAEISTNAMDTAAEHLTVRSKQIAETARAAELQIAALPVVAEQLNDVSDRLGHLAEAYAAESPPATTVAQVLARLDVIAARLESGSITSGGNGDLAALSAGIGQSLERVKEALAGHDGIWPSLASSMEQVQAAASALVEAAACKRDGSEAVAHRAVA
jgi:hypothetical protein